jgi:hypothetical protein
MKGERLLRKEIAVETGCPDWDNVQEICVFEWCACLHYAREELLQREFDAARKAFASAMWRKK